MAGSAIISWSVVNIGDWLRSVNRSFLLGDFCAKSVIDYLTLLHRRNFSKNGWRNHSILVFGMTGHKIHNCKHCGDLYVPSDAAYNAISVWCNTQCSFFCVCVMQYAMQFFCDAEYNAIFILYHTVWKHFLNLINVSVETQLSTFYSSFYLLWTNERGTQRTLKKCILYKKCIRGFFIKMC